MPVPGLKVTSAWVSSLVGGVPAPARPCESAIEKHAECAAAMSSSGLVLPFGSSDRAGQETGYVPMPDDARVTWPLPSTRLPSQAVCAVRVVATVYLRCWAPAEWSCPVVPRSAYVPPPGAPATAL